MPMFRKKPIVIEAVQYTGDVGLLWDWRGAGHIYGPTEDGDTSAYIETLEGRMEARVGDWIIEGVSGELYPCKPDIFAATYDEVGPLGV